VPDLVLDFQFVDILVGRDVENDAIIALAALDADTKILPKTSYVYTLLEWAGVGSIPANSDAQNVPSFRRWRFEMKLSPFYIMAIIIYKHFFFLGKTSHCANIG
jgi:hypothetical protein